MTLLSAKSNKGLVLLVGMIVFWIGAFFLFLGVAYSANVVFCYGGGPCVHQGLLGIADFLVYNFGLLPTSIGILLLAIGLSITIVGLKGGRTGYLQGAGILNFVASMLTLPLMVGGSYYVFGSLSGSAPCSFGSTACSFYGMVILAAFSTAAFATGVAASVTSLTGTYHSVVPIGNVMLLLSALIALMIGLSIFASFVAPVVSMCMVSIFFVLVSRGRLSIGAATPHASSTAINDRS